MDRSKKEARLSRRLRRELFNGYVVAVFLVSVVLSVPAVPPAEIGFLWPAAIDMVAAFGCVSLSCTPYVASVAVVYAYVVGVVIGNGLRLIIHDAT